MPSSIQRSNLGKSNGKSDGTSGPSVRALVAAALAALAGCGEAPRAVDAQVAPSAQSAEVSIRFDVGAGRPSTVQVLAFRATTTLAGASVDLRPDVLGIVDPLAAASPEQGCALRDIDVATTALMIRGGSIELQELTGIGVGLGGGDGVPSGETLLRPFPRLYPDVATVVGGIVAETGPHPITTLPDRLTLFTAESELPVASLSVPAAPRMIALNNVAFETAAAGSGPSSIVDARDGVAVTVAGGAGGRIEIRPFGGTIAAACAIPASAAAESVVTIPRTFVAQLARAMGGPSGAPFSASIELARRTTLRPSPVAGGARVSVEVRSAATVELRP
jgi:hypothetical protein